MLGNCSAFHQLLLCKGGDEPVPQVDVGAAVRVDFMQMWYRDILMYKTTKDINLLIFRDEFSAVKSVSTTSGYDGLEKILEAIDKARIRLDANVNTELVMELMLLTMKEN